MENRITSLLLPIALVIGLFFLLQNFFAPDPKDDPVNRQNAPVAKQITAEDLTALTPESVTERDSEIVFETAAPGEVGFHVVFDNRGGQIRSVRLTDEWVQSGLSEEQKKDIDALYPVIEELVPGLGSFAMEDHNSELPIGDKNQPLAQGARVPRLHELPWRHEELAGRQGMRFWIELENGVRFERDFVFPKGSRTFRIIQRIKNKGSEKAGKAFEYWFRGAMALPYRTGGAAFMPRPMVFAVIDSATGEREHRYLEPKIGQPNAFDLPDVLRVGENAPFTFRYGGSANTFFASILEPADEQTRSSVRNLELVAVPFRAGENMDAFSNCGPIFSLEQTIPAPDATAEGGYGVSELSFEAYLGPKSKSIFESDPALAAYVDVNQIDLERSSCFCSMGSQTFSAVLLSILRFLYDFVGNWGVAIIILTLIVRMALMPLNLRQAKAMREYGERMKVLKPKMDALKKKYEKDPKEMNRQLVQFQRENKLFPPLMGCLPLLLTFPVFIGLFLMLRTSYEMFHQPFALWITDLSVPDRLFYIGLEDLPLLGDSLAYFNLLPVLMVLLWGVNAFRMPLPDDPQQRQQQQIMRFMPIMMGIFLYNYASGLALYMVISALWTLIEQTIVRKKFGPVTGMPTTM
jgi:YidC/Oxa1 family membrane protein insertase